MNVSLNIQILQTELTNMATISVWGCDIWLYKLLGCANLLRAVHYIVLYTGAPSIPNPHFSR